MSRFTLLFLFFLVACQAPNIPPFTVTDFATDSPVLLVASSFQVMDDTTRFRDLPHLESRLPITPAFALKRALENRFRSDAPTAATEVMVQIQTADLTQKVQPAEHWYILNNIEYLLTYQVRVSYIRNRVILTTQEMSGWETQSLPKRSSLAEKEQAWQTMINNMIEKVADKIQADMPPDLFR